MSYNRPRQEYDNLRQKAEYEILAEKPIAPDGIYQGVCPSSDNPKPA